MLLRERYVREIGRPDMLLRARYVREISPPDMLLRERYVREIGRGYHKILGDFMAVVTFVKRREFIESEISCLDWELPYIKNHQACLVPSPIQEF